MLEYPEVLTMASQLKEQITGKKVRRVLPPSKIHKFCWYNGEPETYDPAIRGCRTEPAEGFGIFVELPFENGMRLCFNDGVNARYLSCSDVPKNYQLVIEFEDDTALAFTVAMYGGLCLHDGSYDNEYYVKSRQALSPFSEDFPAYYHKIYADSKPGLSAKAFLAAEQRFPGIGNGTLQDILFAAGIHPKRKIGTFSKAELDYLLQCVTTVLRKMAENGGRNTEKDLFGQKGGYRVKMSKNSLADGCPVCGGEIIKQAYMGGSVYYCPVCQPLNK